MFGKLTSSISIEAGAQQRSMHEQLQFLIYTKDLSEGLTTNSRLFTDDVSLLWRNHLFVKKIIYRTFTCSVQHNNRRCFLTLIVIIVNKQLSFGTVVEFKCKKDNESTITLFLILYEHLFFRTLQILQSGELSRGKILCSPNQI